MHEPYPNEPTKGLALIGFEALQEAAAGAHEACLQVQRRLCARDRYPARMLMSL